MTFDEKMKARAARESCPLPDGFDERMNALLDTLPVKTETPRRRPMRRTIVIGAAAAIFIVGAATATPTVLSMTRSAVDYFSGSADSPYVSQRGAFETYSAAVGVSAVNGARTLTIDNLAVDDSYLNVFYTLQSDTPLILAGADSDPENRRVQWTAPSFWAELDGKPLDTPNTVEREAYLEDARTLKGMERIALARTVPDTFALLLYTGGSSAVKDAEFQFRLAVDKSAVAVESLTVEPGLDFSVDYRRDAAQTDTSESAHIQQDVRIERVSISPFGSTLTLSSIGNPWDSFVLRDDKGDYLTRLPAGGVSSGVVRMRNVYEFLGADLDTKSITLIPVVSADRAHPVSGALTALPLTDEMENGLTLEHLDIGEKKTVAVFSVRGALPSAQAQFSLTGADGKDLPVTGDTYLDSAIDRKTGRITATLYYPDAAPGEIAKASGVSFWQPDPITLLEDQAVTIHLQ